jgi:anti-sigma regulatory factor (Ser/Thr protein kinase)
MMTAWPALELQLDARPEEAATLRLRLSDWLENAGLARKDVFEVTLAATEAFENAVRHPLRPRSPAVDLKVSISDGGLCVSVRDRGTWHRRGPDEGNGLGLPMMRLLMDGVDVQTGADGTTVTMWRALTRH